VDRVHDQLARSFRSKEALLWRAFVGNGKAWADDLQLLVDGKPIGEAPKVERATTVLERAWADL